jgi:hypothetical protein
MAISIVLIRRLGKLKSTLLKSGIQQENQPLYQVINQLLDAVIAFAEGDIDISAISGGGGGGGATTTITGGIPGIDGEAGADGEIGPPGQRGIDGAAGTTGAQGPIGPPGLQGEEGPEGDFFPIPGPIGAQGPTGSQGIQGLQGPPGFDGIDGIDGIDGTPGLQGIQGIQGIQGLVGPPGLDGYDAEDTVVIPGPPGADGTSGGGGFTFTDFTQDLGAADKSGTFDITGLSSLTADKNVLIVQTMQPISSKGDARDEFEMQAIILTGYVLNTTTIRALWNCDSVCVGTYAFAYAVSG